MESADIILLYLETNHNLVTYHSQEEQGNKRKEFLLVEPNLYFRIEKV